MRTLVLGTAMPAYAYGTVLTLNLRASIRLGTRPQRLDSYIHRIVLDAGQAINGAMKTSGPFHFKWWNLRRPRQ